jgi:hypothetical protein
MSNETQSQELQALQEKPLPYSSAGDKEWALATLSVSNIRSLSDDASELVSQVLMGTPLRVLDRSNKWYWIQTPEKYLGWMDGSGLQVLTADEMDFWRKADRYIYNLLSGYAYDAPALESDTITDLILGDLFEVESDVNGFLKIKIPDGRRGYVRKSECISFFDWSSSEPNTESLIQIARQMMGFPYLWGGASSKAVDCSGFVKLVYYAEGIILARDASQQAKYGQPIDFNNINNLQPGDLLFFGSSAQRITHVGIYLGEGSFIHSSGRVHISSIIPGDPKYVAERKNQAACRILSSLNTEGIVSVKEHPWYNNKI